MTKLEQLKKKIVEKVPEIMELKFGCKVWIDDSKKDGEYSIWEYIGDIDIYSNQDTIWKCLYSTFATNIWSNFQLEGKPYVILGREITLADVLRAIDDKINSRSFKVYPNGLLEHGVKEVKWNFSQPLSGQSEETIDFLLTLLNN